jgi:hypothetical protein
MENKIKELENKITEIEKRNKRVELDKSWETSWTRKICIMILTYIVVIIYSYVIRESNNILLSSLVPVIGFTLSTLSLKLVRNIWEKKFNS